MLSVADSHHLLGGAVPRLVVGTRRTAFDALTRVIPCTYRAFAIDIWTCTGTGMIRFVPTCHKANLAEPNARILLADPAAPFVVVWFRMRMLVREAD